jgi:TrmH family RNA methyltransferase
MNEGIGKLKKYQKKFNYSYSFGIYPTLDLLKERGESVVKVILRNDSTRFDGVTEIVDLCKQKNISLEYNDRLIGKIAFKENTYAIGVFRKYESKLIEGENHIVLVEPRNMGNVGTIIRSMVGFGFKNLAIVGSGVDVFSPKVISSTMGNLFKINFEYFSSIGEYVERFGSHNKYSFILGGKKSITEVEFKEPVSLIFGNESKGLSFDEEVGESVYIPHSKELESLNLSVAVSLAMWEFNKK